MDSYDIKYTGNQKIETTKISKRNNESFNSAKEYNDYTIYGLFFPKGNNDIKEIDTSMKGGMFGMLLINSSRASKFQDYITDKERYEEVKQIIKRKWIPEVLLQNRNNSCQLGSEPTISPDILIRGGLSIVLGLRFIKQRVRTIGLNNDRYNNKEADCLRMVNPDEIFGINECRFAVRVDGTPKDVQIKYDNLQSISDPIDLKILELMCGNGLAAKFIVNVINGYGITISNYIATDVIASPSRQPLDLGSVAEEPIYKFDQCDTIDAVERYGRDSNTLLIISPPPGSYNKMSLQEITDHEGPIGYADFYGCHEFIKQAMVQGQKKYIIIVGELGAGDGTEGIYRYLMENANLNLIYRNRIMYRETEMGAFLKEVYIFGIN